MQLMHSLTHKSMADPALMQIQTNVKETLGEVMGDSSPEMLSEMSSIFLEDSLPLILQILDSYSNQEFEVMKAAAHALKGSSATIGLERLAQLCQIIETNSKQHDLDLIGSQMPLLEAEYNQISRALSDFLL